MPKTGEIQYLARIGAAGVEHALGKPYTNPDCGTTLAAIGAIMALLPPPPGRLLDLGCGSGWTSVMYAQRGYFVVGQDLAPDMIDLANENKRRSGLGHLGCHRRRESPTFATNSIARSFRCAPPRGNETASLASAYRALKPGGTLTHEPARDMRLIRRRSNMQLRRDRGVTRAYIMRVARDRFLELAAIVTRRSLSASYLSPRAARFHGASAARCAQCIVTTYRFGRRGGIVVLTK
jgi:SAM-dependent methyltransferase